MNVVRQDGRFKLPPDAADALEGSYLAAYYDGEDKVVLERVNGGSE